MDLVLNTKLVNGNISVIKTQSSVTPTEMNNSVGHKKSEFVV